ncbi:DMT family transporter [Pseudoalteromonas ulvae]|uniref:EamA family transporter n=1 Tax=Pseudoalteromonas ulvae TaxID=107327 RepID=A0A244CPI1_PSEDV|nr:DMT family transporter [Pseudoalteromonas ulvae]OUL57505.1 EamA family transporter [Pseudoalteromonas ulvae]
MQAQQQSLLFLHIAVFLFGGTALFAKLINLPAIDITVYRTAIASVSLMLLMWLTKKRIRLNSVSDYAIAILLGIIIGLHWITYFGGMQLAGVTVGVIAFFSYPVITVFLEPLVNKTTPRLSDLVSAAVVIFGIYLLIPSADLGNDVTFGIMLGVISAFFFATRNILHKNYFSQYSGPHTMLYQTLMACLMLCLFVEVPPSDVTQYDWLLLLLVGIVFTAAPHSLFAASLQNLSATTAGLISCLQPLYGSVLAFLILHEQANWQTVVGGLLVISAAFYETWSVSRKKRK